ncbi:MAG: sulfite exporter TauE/SafE family protein [Gammaproteobacteria bacterium]
MMMQTMTFSAALLAGFMASGHCLGMCGPMTALAAAPGKNATGRRALAYNAGRLASYSFIGAAFGYLGFALGDAAGIARWSVVLRVALGAVMLLIGLQLLRRRGGASAFERFGTRIWARLAPLTRHLNPAGRSVDLFAMGLLWGWLPCGMVYSMLAVAAVSGSASSGAGVMLAFGLGTLPALLGLSLAGSRLRLLRSLKSRRALGLGMILAGIWMAAMPLYATLGEQDDGTHAPHQHMHHH